MQLHTRLAQRFVDALALLERDHDSEPMATIFGDDAKLSRLGRQPEHDPRNFWNDYRAQFDEIASEFTHVAETSDTVTLEWNAEGSLATGRPIRYTGVSIIEVTNTAISSFRTYYDSAAFLAEPPPRADT